MLLTTTPAPSLPLPSHTYYPYPLTSRLKTHSSILQPLSPHAYGYQDPSVSQSKAKAGPGPSSASNAEKRERHRLALKRAEERALAGKRPAGVELGKEADEMSDEEGVIQDERVSSPFDPRAGYRRTRGQRANLSRITSICLGIVFCCPMGEDRLSPR